MTDTAFTLTIRLGNDGMQTGADIQRALSKLAANYRLLGAYTETFGNIEHARISDDNGNRVGEWSITEPRTAESIAHALLDQHLHLSNPDLRGGYDEADVLRLMVAAVKLARGES